MDEKLFHLINEQWTNSAFDLFMPVISYAEIWTPFFLIAAVAFLIFGGFRGRAFVFCTVLTLGLSNLAVDPLKHAIGRPRPKQVQTVRMIELEKTRPMILTIFKNPHVRFSNAAERARSGASFPSGHTNNNTVIAICCTIFYRRWGKLYWIIAAAGKSDGGQGLNGAGALAEFAVGARAGPALHGESLAVCRRLGYQSGLAHALSNLGTLAPQGRGAEVAQALYEKSLATFRGLD